MLGTPHAWYRVVYAARHYFALAFATVLCPTSEKSGMSYGALSDNAILALNQGAEIGGFYHNTGEGTETSTSV